MTQERKEDLAQQLVDAFGQDDNGNAQHIYDNPLFEGRKDAENAGINLTEEEYETWDDWYPEVETLSDALMEHLEEKE